MAGRKLSLHTHVCVKFRARALGMAFSSPRHKSVALIPKWPQREKHLLQYIIFAKEFYLISK